ncbi:unnamed protein product [Diplocarpon coronariae]|nr:hypothetical protein JHW43_004998 [Diplocarpon mali]
MPICTIHLLSLSVSLPSFFAILSSTPLQPLTIARVLRWIILPTSLSTSPLLARNIHWDILLILPSPVPLPQPLQAAIQHHWSIQAGVPARLLKHYDAKNQRLLTPEKGDVPPLTGSLEKGPLMSESSQGLELSPELLRWIEGAPEGRDAVSMLNLLSFLPGKKEEYFKYGQAFADGAGSRRGGNAKIVGSVIHPERSAGEESVVSGNERDTEPWDEVALAHYPSLWHFADMLASADYQAANQRWRVGSLRDTLILCTSEVALLDWREKGGAKL